MIKRFVPVAVLLLFMSSHAMAGHDHGGGGAAPENEMILIPGGEFIMGSSEEEIAKVKKEFGERDLYKNYSFDVERPRRKVFVKAFYMERHEVTNREYAVFVRSTGYSPPPHWNGGMYEEGKDDSPVLYVSWKDATAYAKWVGKRLPTAEEWEKAARGTEGKIYPWGNEFDPFKASTADSDLMAIAGALCSLNSANRVEIAPGDESIYGVHDLGGNVREWTSTQYPNNPDLRVVKGASWVDLHINARGAHVEYIFAENRSHIVGFRCAKDTEDTRPL